MGPGNLGAGNRGSRLNLSHYLARPTSGPRCEVEFPFSGFTLNFGGRKGCRCRPLDTMRSLQSMILCHPFRDRGFLSLKRKIGGKPAPLYWQPRLNELDAGRYICMQILQKLIKTKKFVNKRRRGGGKARNRIFGKELGS